MLNGTDAISVAGGRFRTGNSLLANLMAEVALENGETPISLFQIGVACPTDHGAVGTNVSLTEIFGRAYCVV